MQLRGLLLNPKALNTPTAQIREDAKARSEYGNNYSTACFYQTGTPGKIEDLTDVLLEDWRKLGSCREMGEKALQFI